MVNILFFPSIKNSQPKGEQPVAEKYILVTLHRPSNVDDIENVKQLLNMFTKLAEKEK